MKDRITQFLVNENISSAEFADKIGVQRSSVSHILNGRNSPGTSFIQKMLSVYKNLNPKWLLLGEGNMFGSAEIINQEPSLFPYSKDDQSPSLVHKVSQPEENQNKSLISNDVHPNQKPESESVKVIEQIEVKESPTNVEKKADIKDIERIIVFHQDKTFTEYLPSK